ncbi:MAG: hypothetical protein HC895_04460 [Leptolyngbyaceae cyanobacterium SM1_3_5]|nr:hypothetical protein [Leptolyngbyaceae cyanobacterium SM1_3_5]
MANSRQTIFAANNLLVIGRLDQISRNPKLHEQVAQVEWDLVVCDEAHKMSASMSGGDIKATKRYRLGQHLSAATRHLLLMTGTPHNGKEDDFRLFMALLDDDRFLPGARSKAPQDKATDLIRRLIKEDLRKLDGTPLFPERFAYTVRYQLSELERNLYDEVTQYVCQEFNRADQLADGRRRRIGFALTILQRRLASSPAAIHQSIEHRRCKLETRLQQEMVKQKGKLNLEGKLNLSLKLKDHGKDACLTDKTRGG